MILINLNNSNIENDLANVISEINGEINEAKMIKILNDIDQDLIILLFKDDKTSIVSYKSINFI